MAKRTLVIDLDRCSGCDSCVVACKFENNVALGNFWTTVVPVGPAGTHPDIEMYWLPMQCQQCENSPCVAACSTGAAYRDPDNNVVLIDKETCIGCKSCLVACPYSDDEGAVRPSVRWFNAEENVVEKCTLCNHLTAASDGIENTKDTTDPAHAVPPCVHNCSCKARHYGDLDDPASDASLLIAQAERDGRKVCMVEAEGVMPATRYILSEDIAAWRGLGE
ncbi:MAG: 4Fe-4S dicluster domain-containing protein [Coriobacteriales bacterium]|jgi:Fe-S-cluster-containing dehydrogenase component|nr:4Fe-4S dicluster domain-containing protein [Coriobacteriales bacterium]